jgi:RNA polymerase sigma-70 factor (ECF subfamily)
MTIRLEPRQLLIVAVDRVERATDEAGSAPVGAQDCFEVYQRELNYLLRSLRRMGVPYSELEDVVHEVFLVMHRRWADYDRSRALRPWLFGIAFRVAASQRRRFQREVLDETADAEDAGPRPDDAAMVAQARRTVLRALAKIPLERRAVFVMHDIDEIAMREIAEQLSIPLFTAYSRLRKARKEFEAAVKRLELKGAP